MKERTEVNLPKAPKGPVKIVIDREQNNDALEKNLRKLSNSHQVGIWTDNTTEQHLRDEHVSGQLTSTLSA